MSNNSSSSVIKLQAMLDKVKSLANIKADIKAIESKLTKIKIKGTLDKSATQKEINTKIKSINPKVKIDADTTQAERKIKKIGKQKNKTTITPTVNNTQMVSGIKQAQKQTKTLWERFMNGAIGTNLIRMTVQSMIQAIKDAISSVKELDAIKTNIQMVSDTSDSGVNAMMSSYNAMAKELGSTTKDVAAAANEFLCMGESLSNTYELIRSSQILSKVGMIQSSEAASYLTSSLKGYQVAAEESMDIVSKLTAVDLEAAVSAGGLAEALSKCANIANNSGVTMDRLIGYTAAIGETTQKSMSEVGNSFQALLSRMNNIKIGRFIDDETGESLSDIEGVLNGLGIQLRDTENTYRNFDDVLENVGSRWESFTKAEQNALSVAIAGTRQRENFEALMNNWGNALKYSETAANSAGSALERYGVYQDSIEAKTNQLNASIESLSTNIISEELYSGIIEATTGIVEFLDKTYLLKGTLAGIMAMGVSKAIVSMGVRFITAAKNASQLTAAMNLFDKGTSKQNLLNIGAACKGLSDKQLKLILSTKGLDNEKRKLILAGKGVAKSEQEQTLTTLGFAAAEDKAKLSTFSLKNAINALKVAWATNKTGIVMAGITTVISIASAIIFKYKQNLEEARQKAAELTEAYKQQQSSLDSQIEKYKELKESLDKSNLSVDETRSIKKQLLEIQNSLIDTYGTEASNIDLLNGKYLEQLGLLSDLSKKKAEDYVIEHKRDFKTAKNELGKVRTYKIGEVVVGTDDAKKELVNYLKSYNNELLNTGTMGTNPNAISISVKANAEEADEFMHQLARDLKEWADKNGIDPKIIEPLQIGISKYAGKTMTDELKEQKTVYDEYMKAKILSDDTLRHLYLQSIQAVEDYNKALSSGDGVESAKANLDSIQQSVQDTIGKLDKTVYGDLAEGSQKVFDKIYESVNKNAEAAYQLNQAFENDETVKGYAEQLRGLSDIDLQAINFKDNIQSPGEKAFGALINILGLSEDEVQRLTDKLVELGYVQGKVESDISSKPITLSGQLTKSEESLDKFQSSIKSAADAYTTLLTGNYSSSELLDSIQAINKAASDMGKSVDWESIAASDHPIQAIQDEIESVSKTYADSVLSGTGIEDSDFGQMLANIVQEAYKSEAALSSLNKQIDSLQSAYNSLTDIVAAYNETGYITFDQLQTLLAMEPQYLSCLIDANGQLAVNRNSMLSLANQRLDDAEAQAVQQAITELGQLALQNEKTAVEENAQAFGNAVNNLAVYNEELTETIGEASVASSVISDLNAAISGAESQGATDTQIDTVLNNLNTKLQLIKNTRTGLSKSFGNIMGGSGSGSSSISEASESIDFFDRRVKVLDNSLSHLKATMDNVTGSFGRNKLIGAELGITEEKFNNYSDALAMYTKKADEALSKLPADIAARVRDGAVAMTDFVGDNKDLTEAIKDYESWADKVSDCKQELAELQKEIRQLELDKFNNIMDDFNNQFELRGDSKDLISRQIDLLKEAGELIGESFFTAQINQSRKQLKLLETEKAQLVNQMSSAIGSGRIQAGADEWLEMVNALSDVNSNIPGCKKSIEKFDNSILELHTEVFDRIQEQFSDLDAELSNLIDLSDDFDVSDDKGSWSREGLAQMGLLAQQYELAQYQVQQYNAEIDELNSQYLASRYSASEYADRLSELSSSQWDAVKASESAKDAILELNETRVENEITGIEKEIDAYNELTQAQIDALKASKDLHDYEQSIAEKTKSVTDLERQLAAMQNDTSAATVAKRKKLEEQLAEARKDLEETEYDHSIEAQENALNKQSEDYENARSNEINALRESLNDKEAILAASFETVRANASLIGQEIATLAAEHGITVSNSLISSWQSGENAIASYGTALSHGTSAFIGNIKGVENEVWNLQAQANNTADTLAWMFATKADNLVSELTASYISESNLLEMTDALHQSLIETLEGGYDVSSIKNSLKDIEDSFNRTADAARETADAMNEVATPSGQVRAIGEPLLAVGKISHTTKLQGYAGGTRSSKGDIIVTDEEGYEMKLPRLDSGQYTIANEGTQVLTKEQTDNIYEWSKVDPENLIPVDPARLLPIEPQQFLQFKQSVLSMTPNMFDNFDFPKSMVSNNVNNNVNNTNTINNHFDSMLTFNGAVIDADHITKQMKAISDNSADKAVEKSIRKLSEGIRR